MQWEWILIVSGVSRVSVGSSSVHPPINEMFELVENRLYAYADDSTLLIVVRKPADRPTVAASFNRDFSFCFSFRIVFWTIVAVQGQVEDSTVWDLFLYPPNGTENGSPPSLTTRDRELVSVVEVRIEPGDLNTRPLTPQSVTLRTIPRDLARIQECCMILNPSR